MLLRKTVTNLYTNKNFLAARATTIVFGHCMSQTKKNVASSLSLMLLSDETNKHRAIEIIILTKTDNVYFELIISVGERT